MDRVNATLPMEEPDYILLTLVQGHTAAACGTECPSGQAISANGRCVPNAVVAGATRKTQRDELRRVSEEQRIADQVRSADEQRVANEARASESTRLQDLKRVATERRLADEKRAAEQRVAELKAKAKAEFAAAGTVRRERSADVSQKVIAQAGPEQLPWLKDDQLQAAGTAQQKRPGGMMSIGGPKLAKADLPDSALSVTPDAGPRPIDSGLTDDMSGHDDSAAPDVTAPAEAKQPVNSSQQGLSGTKSGPAAVPGRPGSKSGVAVRGLTGSKSGAAANRYSSTPDEFRPRVVGKKRAPKPKYYVYASNAGFKPKKSKVYKPHYNMMQALSGGFY